MQITNFIYLGLLDIHRLVIKGEFMKVIPIVLAVLLSAADARAELQRISVSTLRFTSTPEMVARDLEVKLIAEAARVCGSPEAVRSLHEVKFELYTPRVTRLVDFEQSMLLIESPMGEAAATVDCD